MYNMNPAPEKAEKGTKLPGGVRLSSHKQEAPSVVMCQIYTSWGEEQSSTSFSGVDTGCEGSCNPSQYARTTRETMQKRK